MRFLSDCGINWQHIYRVDYQDDEIIVLQSFGRYHRFDRDRMFDGKIAGYIDPVYDNKVARIGDKMLLVEIKPEIR